uniref:HNH endonuclease signature motif containing protein n=1 Tax=Rhodococcoides fascians TaxID=1828 RepID=UPI001E2D8967
PRKRRDAFFYLGEQGADGMSEGNFCVDSELRAYLEALFSKAAKPGVNNPADPTSVVHETEGDSKSSAPTPEPTCGDAGSSDAGLWDGTTCNGDSDCSDDDCGDDNGGSCDCGVGADCGCRTESDDTLDSDGYDGYGGSDDTAGTAEPGGHSASDAGGDDGAGAGAGGDDGAGAGAGAGGDGDGDGDDAPDTAVRDAAAARDTRTQNERRHDALKLALRHTLASGTLGTHRGLPVTAIVTMTLKDLDAGCGYAMTGTGSRVSIRDAIRMASHAHHYLTIFDDDGRALYLGRSKRIASADQRIVLIARDRGCSFPSCTRPATWCQAHHLDDWTDGGPTDIDSLTFGCDMHHALVGTGPGKWATTKTTAAHRYPGRTLWHPPTGMDPKRRGLINHAHHPEEVLYPPDHDTGDAGDEEPRQPA